MAMKKGTNMRKHNIVSTLAAGLLAVSLVGCSGGSGTTEATQESQQEETKETTAEADEQATIDEADEQQADAQKELGTKSDTAVAVSLTNGLGVALDSLCVRASGTEAYGENLLGEGATIANAEVATLYLESAGEGATCDLQISMVESDDNIEILGVPTSNVQGVTLKGEDGVYFVEYVLADGAQGTTKPEVGEAEAEGGVAEVVTYETSYEEPTYVDTSYQEPVYEEPVYEEPAYTEPAYEEPVVEIPEVYDETWEDRTLLSADAPLARVTGRLILKNCTIDGAPALQADLLSCFELSEGACVTVSEGAVLSLDVSAMCLNEDDKYALSVTWNGESLKAKKADWSSSNKGVASVSKGSVKAKSTGSAIITATYKGNTAACAVLVVNNKPLKEVNVEKLDFTQLFITMNPGNIAQTTITCAPAGTPDSAITYTSSDESVATVDEGGVVTALAEGKATITASSSSNPSVYNTCQICVVEPGSARMAGLIIGVNPGHQRHTIKEKYPLAPGSSETAYGVKEGACGKFTRVPEYETTLQIGLKLARNLTEQGATVVITRTSNDVQLTNIDRAQMLNEAGVDVALQLHCNSVDNQSKQGNSGYIRTTGDWVEESYAISDCITRSISAVTGAKNLGVKINNNYMSLNWTTTPSVLLEMGYISNKEEDELLASDDYREKLAYAITEGLCEYFGR